MTETLPPLGIQRVKVVALSVIELDRANRFYKEKIGLEPAFEGTEQVGWWLGQVILMLKPDWAVPTETPNPRVTRSCPGNSGSITCARHHDRQ